MCNGGYPILNSPRHLELMKQYFRSPQQLVGYRCQVGHTNLAISPYGEVRICYQMEPIGNVGQQRLKDLWEGEQARACRDTIASCDRGCCIMNCNYNEG